MKKPTIAKLKKSVWDLFSIYIRLRDCLKTTGTIDSGKCVTCGETFHFKKLQAGHFISGRHNANLFSEKGCHAQCKRCNLFLSGNVLVYRRKIIEMYGEGFDEVLENSNKINKQFYRHELETLKEIYKSKIEELRK